MVWDTVSVHQCIRAHIAGIAVAFACRNGVNLQSRNKISSSLVLIARHEDVSLVCVQQAMQSTGPANRTCLLCKNDPAAESAVAWCSCCVSLMKRRIFTGKSLEAKACVQILGSMRWNTGCMVQVTPIPHLTLKPFPPLGASGSRTPPAPQGVSSTPPQHPWWAGLLPSPLMKKPSTPRGLTGRGRLGLALVPRALTLCSCMGLCSRYLSHLTVLPTWLLYKLHNLVCCVFSRAHSYIACSTAQ